MRLKRKTNIITLIIFVLFTAYLTIFINYSLLITSDRKKFYDYNDESECYRLKTSAISGKIHVDNNWTDAKIAGICTGNGTYSLPYVIKDLIIDGGTSGSCIFIENSDVYFRIENCTLYNAGGLNGDYSAGIRLLNVDNSQLINNNCSSNTIGINLDSGDNNTISENIVNFNSWIGIRTIYSENNVISGNTVYNNTNYGLTIWDGLFNNISTNVLKNNKIVGIYSHSSSHNFISGNMINNSNYGIFLAFDSNNAFLGNTLTNNSYGIYSNYCGYITISGNAATSSSYGIYLKDSDSSIILENTVTNNSYGIYSINCSYNTISGNTANTNRYGLYLTGSNYNIISGNTLLGNEQCIVEENCRGNKFSDNGSCKYGENNQTLTIPGYNLILLFGILSVSIIFMCKNKEKRTIYKCLK